MFWFKMISKFLFDETWKVLVKVKKKIIYKSKGVKRKAKPIFQKENPNDKTWIRDSRKQIISNYLQVIFIILEAPKYTETIG